MHDEERVYCPASTVRSLALASQGWQRSVRCKCSQSLAFIAAKKDSCACTVYFSCQLWSNGRVGILEHGIRAVAIRTDMKPLVASHRSIVCIEWALPQPPLHLGQLPSCPPLAPVPHLRVKLSTPSSIFYNVLVNQLKIHSVGGSAGHSPHNKFWL